MHKPYLMLGIVALGIILGFTIPFHTNKGIGILVGWVSGTVLARYVVSSRDSTDMARNFGWLSFGFLTLSVVSLSVLLIRWNLTAVEEFDALLFVVCIILGMVGLSCLWFFALSRLEVPVGDASSDDSMPK